MGIDRRSAALSDGAWTGALGSLHAGLAVAGRGYRSGWRGRIFSAAWQLLWLRAFSRRSCLASRLPRIKQCVGLPPRPSFLSALSEHSFDAIAENNTCGKQSQKNTQVGCGHCRDWRCHARPMPSPSSCLNTQRYDCSNCRSCGGMVGDSNHS